MLKNFILASLYLVALGVPHLSHAEEAPVEAVPVQALPEETMPAKTATASAKQPANSTQPLHDNHTDYRYCLELKTNPEIAACRYKKK
jgi:hypothetical protein